MYKIFDNLYDYLPNILGYLVLGLGLCIYFAYYLLVVVKRPMLICSDGPLKTFLLNEIPALSMKFWPTIWCLDSRVQTFIASVLRSTTLSDINYRREILTLKDGGEVALDWLDENCSSLSPCILILPGLIGNSQDDYVKLFVLAANKAGMRVVVFNNRGLGGIEVKTPLLYNACKVDDLSEVVQYVRKVLPEHVKLGATGISLGGLVLGNYLARRNEEARRNITAAKIVSVPWQVNKAIDSMEQPFLNSLMGMVLTQQMQSTIRKTGIYKQEHGLDETRIQASKTMREFDVHFTIKHFGYPTVEDYYKDASLPDKLHHISVPLLCLNAADDPLQPMEGIPIEATTDCTHVAIIVTSRGGHIGFLEGMWPSLKNEYMSRIFTKYFKKTLYDERGEFQSIKEDLHKEYLQKQAVQCQ
ncbi:phospholipase ABHD3-like [Eurosta solidaginis]|uniref:phospholipase ABHD3-like n=1 Tax=Eurosta solidaginis TaxID=178769 RepID=UPI0035316083